MLDTEQASIARPKVLTVSELNRLAKEVLEQSSKATPKMKTAGKRNVGKAAKTSKDPAQKALIQMYCVTLTSKWFLYMCL